MSAEEQESSSDGVDTFSCDVCGNEIDKVRYNCSKCEDYDICEHCFIQSTDDDEEERPRHPHKLTAIKLPVKASIVFSYTTANGNSVHVGNFACALPGSVVLKEKKIGAVLSLIELPHPNREIAPLAQLYSDGSDSLMDGVVYHHLPVADIANPALIGPEGAMALFPETTSFISESLKAKRNVLVHCELGQRRSPLAFLAWMVTQNLSAQSAISRFASGHKENGAAWKEKFVSTRAKWIEKLEEWSKNWSSKLKDWQRKNAEDLNSWFADAPEPLVDKASPSKPTKMPSKHEALDEKPAPIARSPTSKPAAAPSKKRARVIDDDDEDDLLPTRAIEPSPKKVKASEMTGDAATSSSATAVGHSEKPPAPAAVTATSSTANAKPKGGTITSFFKKAN
eukprot:TRINITY_DN13865_c0_g1_i1.p1 TRINITY_DN13865_c0_g1~~TRINITY_DN13865_c0_g1_i1.p1  ORF type:complete len:396 (+),score=75.63 TRINITY_DN13865_c0_g1_i1:36-1223(+)